MSRTVTLGRSGVGKSYYNQSIISQVTPNFDIVLIFDYEGEYKGLCKDEAPFKSFYVDRKVAKQISKKQIANILKRNKYVRLEPEGMSLETIRDFFSEICIVLMDEDNRWNLKDKSVFLSVDESQKVISNNKIQEPASRLGTGARKYFVEWNFISQRSQLISKDILSQADYAVIFELNDERTAKKASKYTQIKKEKIQNLGERKAFIKNFNSGEVNKIHTDNIPQPYEHIAGDDGRADEIFERQI